MINKQKKRLDLFQDGSQPTLSWHLKAMFCFMSKWNLHTLRHTLGWGGGDTCMCECFLVSIQLEKTGKICPFASKQPAHSYWKDTFWNHCLLLAFHLPIFYCLLQGRHNKSLPKAINPSMLDTGEWAVGAQGVSAAFLLWVPQKSGKAKSIFYSHTLNHC